MLSIVLHCVREGGPARGTVALQKMREGAILKFGRCTYESVPQGL